MKIIKLKIFVLSILFLQFVFVFEAHAQTNKNFEIVNYCKLFIPAGNSGKMAQTTAILYVPAENYGSDYLYSAECNNKDFFALTDFSNAKNSSRMKAIWEKAELKDSPSLYLVTINGKFTDFLVPGGPYGQYSAEFIVDEIKSIKPIKSKYNLPDTKSLAPMSETGNALLNFNNEFIVSFFGRGFSGLELESLIADNSKITVDNKTISKEDFIKISLDRKDGDLSVKLEQVSKNNDEWRAQGTITQYIGNGTKKIIFDNTYLRKGNAWNSWQVILVKINNE